jgi:hypothetical protein
MEGTAPAANVTGPPGQGIAAGDFAAAGEVILTGPTSVPAHSTLCTGGELRGHVRAHAKEREDEASARARDLRAQAELEVLGRLQACVQGGTLSTRRMDQAEASVPIIHEATYLWWHNGGVKATSCPVRHERGRSDDD